ncbi:MAG TPA: hypothetical protein DCZ06_01350 [Alphaproteobacteria bacterium]|nr:hypothetical protein [Alphaproteobacteria bacterium]
MSLLQVTATQWPGGLNSRFERVGLAMEQQRRFRAPLKRAQVQHLYASVPAGFAATAMIVPVIGYLLRDQVPLQLILIWSALVIGAFVIRLSYYIWFRTARADCSENFWRSMFRFGIVITGFAWGTMPWLFFAHCDPVTQMGMTAIFIIAPIVVIFGTVSDLKTAFIYAAAIYPSISIWWAQQPGDGIVYALLALACGAIAILLAWRTGKMTMAYLAQTYEIERALQESHASSHAKTQFFRAMGHELRTPLNAILGFSELIATERIGPLKPVRYRDYAEDILQSGRNLSQLLDDLFDLSKVERADYSLRLEPVNLHAMVTRVTEMTREQARQKAIMVENRVQAKTSPVRTDPLVLRHILLALLTNALTYTDTGGHIHISAAPDSSGQMILAIADDGPPPAVAAAGPLTAASAHHDGVRAPDIQQASRPAVTRLGLATAENLTHRLGCEMDITDSPMGGARISLRFSARHIAKAQKAIPESVAA